MMVRGAKSGTKKKKKKNSCGGHGGGGGGGMAWVGRSLSGL